MASKLIFLGTGSGSEIVGKQIKGSGGIAIVSGDSQFIIDPGPGALVKARDCKLNLRETMAVLISHGHNNHCSDLNAVISAMTLNGLDINGVLIAPKSVVEGDEKVDSILTNFHKNCLERVIIVEQDKKIGVADVDIDVTRAQHSVEAVGYKISFENFIISYVGDTSYSHKVAEAHKDADILILNVVAKDSANYNLTIKDAIRFISEVKPSLAVLTHFSLEMVKEDPILIARHIQRETSIQTIAAKDGLDINPMHYAKTSRQKNLKNY